LIDKPSETKSTGHTSALNNQLSTLFESPHWTE